MAKSHIAKQQGQAAIDYLRTIESASGYIAIQAQCLVKHEADILTLELTHPVNTYLSTSNMDNEASVIFRILCSQDSLTTMGKGTFSIGSAPKVTCLGRVVGWENYILTISPIAMY
jgi:hypothetical protein